MKFSHVINGIVLVVLALVGASFTAEKSKLVNSYIQKPGICQPIPLVECVPGPLDCFFNDGTGTYGVYQSQRSPQVCDVELRNGNE